MEIEMRECEIEDYALRIDVLDAAERSSHLHNLTRYVIAAEIEQKHPHKCECLE